jgi:hypothetical protein
MADGNPFYNQNIQGPDWGSGIMAVYANLERLKQQKLAEQMMQQKFGLEQQKAASEEELNTAQANYYNQPKYVDRDTDFDKRLKLLTENPDLYHKMYKDVTATTKTEFEQKKELLEKDPKTYQKMFGEKSTSETKTAASYDKMSEDFKKELAKIDRGYQDELGKSSRGYGMGKSQAMINFMSLGFKTPQEAGKAYDENYNKSVEDLKSAREMQIDSLIESYSELPQAKFMKKGRGKNTPPAPSPSVSPETGGPTATDPKTGKKVQWNGKEWVLIQ